MPAVI